MPSSRMRLAAESFDWIAAAIWSKRSAWVAAYTSPEPNSRNAEPTLPITRYFSPLSSEASDHTSERAQHVQRDREQLERDEQHEQAVRRREQRHARRPRSAAGRGTRRALVEAVRSPRARPSRAPPRRRGSSRGRRTGRPGAGPDMTSQSGGGARATTPSSPAPTNPSIEMVPEMTRALAPDTTELMSSSRHASTSGARARPDRRPLDDRGLDHLLGLERRGRSRGLHDASTAVGDEVGVRREREHGRDERDEADRLPAHVRDAAGGRRCGRLGPRGVSCRTAEIQRSMYMAASTIASDATMPTSQCSRKAPSSTRNSEANRLEPGTASAPIPVTMQIVASAGRPGELPSVRTGRCRSAPRRSPRSGRAAARAGRG